MLRLIFEMAEYVSLISLVIAVLSAFAMLEYLKKKGIVSSRIANINPLILLEYPRLTKLSDGRIGVWFWVFVCSILLLFVSGIIELILYISQSAKN